MSTHLGTKAEQAEHWRQHIADVRVDYPRWADCMEAGITKDTMWNHIDRRTLTELTGPAAQEMLRAFPEMNPRDRASIVWAVACWKRNS